MRKRILLGLFCGLVGLSAVVQADAPRYRVTKIADGEKKNQEHITAYALNNRGEVVGQKGRRPFLWRNGVFTLLEPFKGRYGATAYDINDHGQIVGSASFYERKNKYFFWQKGKTQDLGAAPDLFEYIGLNNKGEVLFRADGERASWAVLWQSGRRKNLGAWWACDINDQSQIAGGGNLPTDGSDGSAWGVIWEKGEAIVTGKTDSVATQINNKGAYVLVEPSSSPEKLFKEVFLVENGQRTIITSSNTQAISIASMNNHAQLVGWGRLADKKEKAGLWQNNQWFDLNKCIPSDSGWILTQAWDINEKGQIVGSGTYNDEDCAFLLTPIE